MKLYRYVYLIVILGLMNQYNMNGQDVTVDELEGVWKFNSWKTLYANFHPDMEPEENSDLWDEIEIGSENPTSVVMEVVFKARTNLNKSTMKLINKTKSGPWLDAEFIINGEVKEAWWEYDKEENVITFVISGYEYNLYFYVKELNDNRLTLVEKLYKTESDAYFHYTTLTKEE